MLGYKLSVRRAREDANALISILMDIEDEYQKILNECPTNHADCDYIKIIAREPWLFPNIYEKHNALMVKGWHNAKSLFFEYSWMTLHFLFFIGINYIIYLYILEDAVPIK